MEEVKESRKGGKPTKIIRNSSPQGSDAGHSWWAREKTA